MEVTEQRVDSRSPVPCPPTHCSVHEHGAARVSTRQPLLHTGILPTNQVSLHGAVNRRLSGAGLRRASSEYRRIQDPGNRPNKESKQSQIHQRTPRLRASSTIQITTVAYMTYQQMASAAGIRGNTSGATAMDTTQRYGALHLRALVIGRVVTECADTAPISDADPLAAARLSPRSQRDRRLLDTLVCVDAKADHARGCRTDG